MKKLGTNAALQEAVAKVAKCCVVLADETKNTHET